MKIYYVIVFLSVLVVLLSSSLFGEALSIKVVDGNGIPIKNARVQAMFITERNGFDGMTNDAGTVVRSLKGGTLDVTVFADGFYPSAGKFANGQGLSVDGEKEVTVMLRRRGNSHLMRKVDIRMPNHISLDKDSFSKSMGFDLLVGDFTKPFGDGDFSDVIISFSDNGIIESVKAVENWTHLFIFNDAISSGSVSSLFVPPSKVPTEVLVDEVLLQDSNQRFGFVIRASEKWRSQFFQTPVFTGWLDGPLHSGLLNDGSLWISLSYYVSEYSHKTCSLEPLGYLK